MNIRTPLLGALLACAAVLSPPPAAAAAIRVAAPVQHGNLAVFLVHGADEADHRNVLTLQEAMARKVLKVHETSDVNQLALENTSPTHEVFIQSGDIVKGGKQDRMLSVGLVVPPNSGRVPIEAFCVESGRWTQREGENAAQFSSSNERIVSKDLKLAANRERSQSAVWQKVAEVQGKLSEKVGTDVSAAASRTSLQLSLENRQVAASVEEYVAALSGLVERHPDAIGYAFAINGKLNSAEVYGSHALFAKLWPKLLKATATEAVAEAGIAAQPRPATRAEVEGFLSRAESATAQERSVSPRMSVVTRENDKEVVFETRDAARKGAIHRSYVAKD